MTRAFAVPGPLQKTLQTIIPNNGRLNKTRLFRASAFTWYFTSYASILQTGERLMSWVVSGTGDYEHGECI